MNVSLPEAMKAWVEGRTEDGVYSNASDYVRDLIRRDQERTEKVSRMQQLVTEGLESGVSPQSMSEIEAAARREASGNEP